MTRSHRLFAAALLWLCCAPAFAEKWALLIGINDYEDRTFISSLGAADNDARKLKETLKETMGFPEANIDLLVSDGDPKPTRSNIVNALARLGENARPGDTVFVFYSGHGTEIEGKTYLLPHDFRGRNKFSATETGLEIARFNEMLRLVKARALIMVWDMCRNNPFPTGKAAAATRNPMPDPKGWNAVKAAMTPRDGAPPITVSLFACSTGETSFEWTEKGRGYFAYFLEKGMRGEAADAQGSITLDSLSKYVQRQVPEVTKRNEGTAQTPYPDFGGAGAHEFVLATGKPNPAAARPAPTVQPGAETLDLNATMIVKVNVAGAKVLIDRKPLAGTVFTTELIDAPTATFEVVVQAGGYRSSAATVTLTRGKTYTHSVTLSKAAPSAPTQPEPAAKSPEKSPPPSVPPSAKPRSAKELAARMLLAHRWEEFQKIKSVRLTGSGKMAPESEDLKELSTTFTPDGRFRLKWVDSAGRNEAGGESTKMWIKLNGALQPDIPYMKGLLYPYGAVGVAATLLESGAAWARITWDHDVDALRLMENANGLKTVITVVPDPATYLLRRIEIQQTTSLGTTTVVCQIFKYLTLRGIPIPATIKSEVSAGGSLMSLSHTYTVVEGNIALGSGFNEAN